MLSNLEKQRYERQISINEITEIGQMKLKKSKFVCIGAGGLGSVALLYLAAAGVGHITLIDRDQVVLSNLNRQIIHFDDDIGKEKVISASEKLKKLNPQISIKSVCKELSRNNAAMLIQGHDILLCCVDNMETRYMVNEECSKLGLPHIEAGAAGFGGFALNVVPGVTPCFNCLYPRDLYTESKSISGSQGVLGVTAGFAGMMQANYAIQYILGYKEHVGKVFLFDLINHSFESVVLSTLQDCLVCRTV